LESKSPNNATLVVNCKREQKFLRWESKYFGQDMTNESLPSESAKWTSILRCGFGLLGLFLASCIDLEPEPEPIPLSYGSITDARDGQVYRTLTVEGMTWLQQDLNFNAPGSICPDTTSVCSLHLYSWSTAMGVDSKFDTTLLGASSEFRQGACPAGWHIPTMSEWLKLKKIMGFKRLPEDWGTNEKTGFGLKGWYQSGNQWYGLYWIPEEAGLVSAKAASFYTYYDINGHYGVLEVTQNPGIKKGKTGIRCLLDGAK
jgi:uncharacterized protein (TIGR02145 family)